jgi:hypothetical protein
LRATTLRAKNLLLQQLCSDFYDKQLKGVTQGDPSYTSINEIDLTVAGGKLTPESTYNPNLAAEAVRYVIVDVPEASTVTINGDLGTNAEKNVVVVRVADSNVGVLDTNNLKVDTSNLSNVATSDVFEIELLTSSRNDEAGDNDDGLGASGVDKDTVVLDYNTDISGFGLYQVQNGEVSWKTNELDADGNIVWVIENVQPKLKYFAALDTNKDAFSNLPLSLAELQANSQFLNFLDTGTIKIQIYPGQESDLQTFLSSDPALKIVGYKVVVETLTYNLTTGKFDSAPTDLSGTTIQAGLDAITFDGFVNTKAAIEALQGTAWDAASYKTLTDVSAQLDIIKGAVGVNGSILNAIGELPTYSSADNRFANTGETGAGSGLYQSVADMIDQSLIALEGGVSNGFDTLKEIEDYITNLKTLIGDSDGALGGR